MALTAARPAQGELPRAVLAPPVAVTPGILARPGYDPGGSRSVFALSRTQAARQAPCIQARPRL